MVSNDDGDRALQNAIKESLHDRQSIQVEPIAATSAGEGKHKVPGIDDRIENLALQGANELPRYVHFVAE